MGTPVCFELDHVHLFSLDPLSTSAWYERTFGARVLRSLQSDGRDRIDLDFGGTRIYLARLPDNAPRNKKAWFGPQLGLEHFGFRVEDVDAAVEQLRSQGVAILMEPNDVRPGVRIAFVRGPDDVRIEILHRSAMDFPDK